MPMTSAPARNTIPGGVWHRGYAAARAAMVPRVLDVRGIPLADSATAHVNRYINGRETVIERAWLAGVAHGLADAVAERRAYRAETPDFGLGAYAEGWADGWLDGFAESRLQERILLVQRILRRRGVPMSPEDEKRMNRCRNAEMLWHWVDLAVTATDVHELFALDSEGILERNLAAATTALFAGPPAIARLT